MIELVVPGAPRGKGRPRFGNGRAFTDQQTMRAESDILGVWQRAGEPRLDDGPVRATITLIVERPKSHLLKDGTLSTAGARMPFPCAQKPDVDNAMKLVCDALNTRAYRDDVQIVDARVVRCWAVRGQLPHTRIELEAAV